MKLIICLFIFASSSIWLPGSGFAAPEPQKQVSLDDAKRYAIENNFRIQGLKSRRDEIEAQKAQIFSSFYPRLGVAGGADTELSGQNMQTAPLGFVYGSYNLFNGFSDLFQAKRSDVELRLNETQLRKAVLEVGLEIEKYFNLYLLKKYTLENYKEALETNQKHVALVNRRRASGLVSQADAMEFELRDSLLRSEMASIDQEMTEARLSLIRQMGPSVGTSVVPVGELPHLHLKDELNHFLARVKDTSSEILTANQQLEDATLQLKSARATWLPSIDLEARAGYLDLEERPQGGGTAFAGAVVARWELFSGFNTTARINEAEALRNRRELEMKQTLLTSLTDLEVAFRRLKSIEERVDLEEKNETRAQQFYKAVLSEYQRGLKNGSDVREAEEALLEAKIRQENFKYQFILNKLDLERSSGAEIPTDQYQERHADQRR